MLSVQARSSSENTELQQAHEQALQRQMQALLQQDAAAQQALLKQEVAGQAALARQQEDTKAALAQQEEEAKAVLAQQEEEAIEQEEEALQEAEAAAELGAAQLGQLERAAERAAAQQREIEGLNAQLEVWLALLLALWNTSYCCIVLLPPANCHPVFGFSGHQGVQAQLALSRQAQQDEGTAARESEQSLSRSLQVPFLRRPTAAVHDGLQLHSASRTIMM